MSVFALLKSKRESHVGKRKPDELSRGVPYKVYKFNLRRSDFEDKPKSGVYPNNLIAFVLDPHASNRYYVTMPSLYNDLSEEHVQELNNAIQQNKAPFIVFYGKDGKRNECILHESHESVDQEKLQSYKEMEAMSPQRKKARNSLESSGSFSSQDQD